MKNEIQTWLNVLKGVSIINISIICVYIVLFHNAMSQTQAFYSILVAIYVLVCAIRSLWPRLDTKCTCVFNNKISLSILSYRSKFSIEVNFRSLKKETFGLSKLDK